MKRFSLITLTSILYSYSGIGQSCHAVNVINPTVAKPTTPVIVSVTCSTMVVKWTGTTGQTYIVTATRYNPTTNKKDTVSGSAPVLVSGLDYTSTIPVVAGTRVTWNVQASSVINGVTYYSYPLEGTPVNYPILACGVAANTIGVSGKVFLQGPFNASTNKMENSLNTLGILQASAASQPYNVAPFNYPGAESVGAGFFAAHPTIIDWVLIELRDSVVTQAVLAARAAFVTQDGSLLDTNGVSTSIVFNNMQPANYYVSIRHRNHLAVCSGPPINLNTGTAAYDFTNTSSTTYGSNAQVQINLKMFLWAGNASLNNVVSYNGAGNDKNAVLGRVGLGTPSNVVTGYYREDLNLDGLVRYTGANNDKNVILASVGLPTPNNVIIEQLPVN